MGSKKASRASQHSPKGGGGRKRRVITRLPMAARNMRIGLLGGSFNPPHEAHREISLTALKRLGLDQVWWLVTPGNPLKDPSKLASLESRVEAARKMARHPRIEVTGFAGGSAYTIDLLAELKRRFPGVNFVWLMGADNLADFHRWQAWQQIFERMPIAVLDRPGFRPQGAGEQGGAAFCPLSSRRIGRGRARAPRAARLDHPQPQTVRPLLDRAARQESEEEKGERQG